MESKQLTLEMVQYMTTKAIETHVAPKTNTLVLVTPEFKEHLSNCIKRTSAETLETCIFDIEPEDLAVGQTVSISCCNRPYDICSHWALIPYTEITIPSEQSLKDIVFDIGANDFSPMGVDETLFKHILDMKRQIELLKANGMDDDAIKEIIINEAEQAITQTGIIPCTIQPSNDGRENSFDIIL